MAKCTLKIQQLFITNNQLKIRFEKLIPFSKMTNIIYVNKQMLNNIKALLTLLRDIKVRNTRSLEGIQSFHPIYPQV